MTDPTYNEIVRRVNEQTSQHDQVVLLLRTVGELTKRIQELESEVGDQ